MRKALDEARCEPCTTLVTGSARLATRPGRKRRAATRSRPEKAGYLLKRRKCVRFSGRKWGERCTHWRQYVSVSSERRSKRRTSTTRLFALSPLPLPPHGLFAEVMNLISLNLRLIATLISPFVAVGFALLHCCIVGSPLPRPLSSPPSS